MNLRASVYLLIHFYCEVARTVITGRLSCLQACQTFVWFAVLPSSKAAHKYQEQTESPSSGTIIIGNYFDMAAGWDFIKRLNDLSFKMHVLRNWAHAGTDCSLASWRLLLLPLPLLHGRSARLFLWKGFHCGLLGFIPFFSATIQRQDQKLFFFPWRWGAGSVFSVLL